MKRSVAAAVLALFVGGCGTISDFSTKGRGFEDAGPHVYGGTRLDVNTIANPDITSENILVFFILDVPFSFLADTIVLPVTIVWAIVDPEAEAPPADSKSN